ncbi:MAG: hypothetical protein ABI797_07975, partial [Chloroflexota bacterium]
MRALLSVANRDGLADFARNLAELKVELFATPPTAAALADAGVKAKAAEASPDKVADYDLVAANVSSFAPQVGARSVPLDEAIGMIDVAGAALVAAAARNYATVGAACDPRQYTAITDELRELGSLSADLRQRLAADALADVAAYFAEVAGYLNHLGGTRFPNRLAVVVEKVRDLAYGENPQQHGALYRETMHRTGSLADALQLQGNQPTFNDLLDLDAAYRIATDFTAPTCCIVKQANPT